MKPPFRYSVFGLNLCSDFHLPELRPSDAKEPAEVEILEGGIPEELGTSPGHSISAEGTLLNIAGVARYLVREGRQIIVQRLSGSSDANVRLFLLGSAMGVLLHQRGVMPLHANAIEVDGRAVAFCGHSGAGKSTIAAWFHDRGYRILSDDVCAIGFDEQGVAIAYPGIPRLRLWREALEASGREVGSFSRSFDDMDKYDVPTTLETEANPVPLDRVYLLRKAAEGVAQGAITRLSGVEAVDALVANTYRGAYLQTIGETGRHLRTCLLVARKVAIFRAERLWGLETFDQEARLLELHSRNA